MASPQIENGYFKISNEIMNALVRIRIPGETRQVLDAILRKTYGWGKKSDKISLSQFMKMTGLSKVAICKSIIKLIEMNLITKKGNAKSLFTKKGNDVTTTYAFQKDYDHWRTLPKKVTLKHVTQKGNHTLPKKVPTINTNTKDNYCPNSEEVRMAELLFSLMRKRNPGHKKPDIQKWSRHIDRMIRLDNRKIDDIEKIIHWAQEDSFWHKNILSTEKLRDKFDDLYLKAGLNGNKKRFDEIGHQEATH